MLLPILAVIGGIVFLIWSAERFVDGAAAIAHHFGMPALLIGMVVGFGTSAPELVVSTIAASQNNPGIALGNAYGSNIANIGLILGLTAVLAPITVQSQTVRRELPILLLVTLLAGWQLANGYLGRNEALVLLGLFFLLIIWSIRHGLSNETDPLATEVEVSLQRRPMPVRRALPQLVLSLLVLVVSSRVLVWGAVGIAQSLGASDLLIGLTVVAVGTSLPELASSIVAVRKGEHDLALGNVIGSNLFNTLMVVGVAAVLAPTKVDPGIMQRDWPVMLGFTLVLLIMGIGRRGAGRVNRVEGGFLILCYLAYVTFLIRSHVSG